MPTRFIPSDGSTFRSRKSSAIPTWASRFYLFEMTDLWMKDFDTPGTRTQGGKAANYLLTGPGLDG